MSNLTQLDIQHFFELLCIGFLIRKQCGRRAGGGGGGGEEETAHYE